MATYPNSVVRFHASDTILRAGTDASYLSEPQACSRAEWYFFLVSIHSKCALECLNGPADVNSKILKFVAASTSEAETEDVS